MTTNEEKRHQELCAYVFGELEGAERAAFEAKLATDPALQAEKDELERTVGLVQSALPAEALSPAIRAQLTHAAEKQAARDRFTFLSGGPLASAPLQAAAGVLVIFGATWWVVNSIGGEDAMLGPKTTLPAEVALLEKAEADAPGRAAAKAQSPTARFEALDANERRVSNAIADAETAGEEEPVLRDSSLTDRADVLDWVEVDAQAGYDASALGLEAQSEPQALFSMTHRGPGDTVPPGAADAFTVQATPQLSAGQAALSAPTSTAGPGSPGPAANSPGPAQRARASSSGAQGFFLGRGAAPSAPPASAGVPPTAPTEAPMVAGTEVRYFERVAPLREQLRQVPQELAPEQADAYGITMGGDPTRGEGDADEEVDLALLALPEVALEDLEDLQALGYAGGGGGGGREAADEPFLADELDADDFARARERRAAATRESVEAFALQLTDATRIAEGETPNDMFFRTWGASPFVRTADDPLSTFSADVDTSSYTLARRTLREGHLPVPEQVRTEEFLNYFRPDVPTPDEGTFRVAIEAAPSPFTPAGVELLRVVVRAKDVPAFERQPLALTFVVDVSGSMEDGGRLDLVKDSLELLTTQLTPTDALALISFTEDATVRTPMTTASARGVFEDEVARLVPEGGTNIESGLMAGYELAANALTPHAVNRVVLLSDGVGNIGETDQSRLLEQVESFRSQGIYLNTIGVGMGNHNDAFLEQLADRGDGINQYIDSAREAEKALVDEFTKTLQPVARDVKIQVEFDPVQVQSYRQLGYENRVVADAGFRNDAVDAGEVNAGHQVVALYEIVRTGAGRLQSGAPLATVRVRHKQPFAVDAGELNRAATEAAEVATEVETSITPADVALSFQGASFGFRRSVLAAQFAEVLRRSIHVQDDSLETLVTETRKLADVSQDAEIEELYELLQLAQPHLDERAAQDADDELIDLLDQLARLHYEAGVREQVRKDGEEPDEELEASAAEEIAALEARVRKVLFERYGVAEEEPPLTDDELQMLEALGYGGDER